MKLKRYFKKDENGCNIMLSGAVVCDYSVRTKLRTKFEKLKELMKSLDVDVAGVTLPDLGIIKNDKPELDYIKVLSHNKDQKFTPRLVDQLLSEGVLTIGGGKITLHSKPELEYDIIQMPGIYCCHDGVKLPDQITARKYIADNFSNIESPDKSNPSGYRVDNFYFCILTKVTPESE